MFTATLGALDEVVLSKPMLDDPVVAPEFNMVELDVDADD